MSRVVDEMESAGLVERRPNPADGRSIIVVLTAKGRREFRAAAPVYLRGIAEHFSRLFSAEDLECVSTALDRVVAAHAGRR